MITRHATTLGEIPTGACRMKTFWSILVLSAFAALSGTARPDCPECDRAVGGSGSIKIACPCRKRDPLLGFQDRASLMAEVDVSATPQAARPAATPETRRASVVRITFPAQDRKVASGSGVVVEHGGKAMILTAHHVGEDRIGDATVHYPDGTKIAGRVAKEDPEYDLAVVECEKYPAAPLAIAAPPHAMEPLTLAGYGSSPYTYREADGRIIGRWRPARDLPDEQIEISNGAREGDSGGPIFNESSEVAGILFGSKEGRTWATHSGRIVNFLDGKRPANRAPHDEYPFIGSR